MVCVKGINRVNHVTVIVGLLLAASALTMGCPFDAKGKGSLTGPITEPVLCSDAADCEDNNACTIDTCEGDVCHHANADDAAPDDGQECTADACVDGTASHAPSGQGTPCDSGAKVCNTMGQCVDCSGAFGCAGQICFQETSCVSCADGQQNGGESDIDCGGPDCDQCADGKQCVAGEDCVSGRCDAGVCTSCTDSIKNGEETDVDCGGSGCDRCNGEPCDTDGECLSTHCFDTVCCNQECDNTCSSCNLSGKVGACTFVPEGSDDEDPSCTGSMTCDGAGDCEGDTNKAHFGDSCANDGECFNGACHEATQKCRLKTDDPCGTGDQCESSTCGVDKLCD